MSAAVLVIISLLLLLRFVESATARNLAIPRPFMGALKIIQARFATLDVTTKVRNKFSCRITSAGTTEFYIAASTAIFTDALPGYTAALAVGYQFHGQTPRLALATAGNNLVGDNTAAPYYYPVSDVVIYGAYYGYTDVTTTVVSLAQGGTFNIPATNAEFTDLWHGNVKVLIIFFRSPAGVDTLSAVDEGGYINMRP